LKNTRGLRPAGARQERSPSAFSMNSLGRNLRRRGRGAGGSGGRKRRAARRPAGRREGGQKATGGAGVRRIDFLRGGTGLFLPRRDGRSRPDSRGPAAARANGQGDGGWYIGGGQVYGQGHVGQRARDPGPGGSRQRRLGSDASFLAVSGHACERIGERLAGAPPDFPFRGPGAQGTA